MTDVETPIAASRPVALAEGPDGPDARGARQRSNVTRVVSAETPLRQRLTDIWSRRELLVRMVRTEISVKYKNSALGLMWSMLNPALNLAVYFLVFQVILRNGMPRFVIFLFSGLLLWNLFQVGVQTGTSVVVANAGLVKKVNFPREILSLASVGSAFYFFLFQCVVMVIFMVVLHSAPAWNYLPLCLLALAGTLVFAAALGLFLSAVNVYLRDTQHLVEVLMTAWFWACPIVYQYQQNIGNHLTGKKAWLYFLNPLVAPVLTFQRAIYAQVTVQSTNTPSSTIDVLPHHGMAWYATLDFGVLLASAVLFLVALGIFGRLEGNFAEEL